MASFSRLEVLRTILDEAFVPLFHHADPATAAAVLRAIAAGGARVVEFTNRGDGAHEVFAQLERLRREEFPQVLLGAGSVIDAPTAGLYLNIGAAFVVGPSLNPDVARVCNRRKVAYLPGCATPRDVSEAEELGCEIVKVFPGDAAGGPGFVRAVLGPSPWSLLMPTGGVTPTEESLRAWFDAGAACVGLGSALLRASDIDAGRWAELTERVRQTRRLVGRCREKGP